MLEAVTGFVFQTALSYPHRIPRPECGYAEGHRQHHYPTGRHGDYKVRLCFQLSSAASPHPRLSLDAEQQQQDPPSERLQLVLCIHLFLLLSFLYELFFSFVQYREVTEMLSDCMFSACVSNFCVTTFVRIFVTQDAAAVVTPLYELKIKMLLIKGKVRHRDRGNHGGGRVNDKD